MKCEMITGHLWSEDGDIIDDIVCNDFSFIWNYDFPICFGCIENFVKNDDFDCLELKPTYYYSLSFLFKNYKKCRLVN